MSYPGTSYGYGVGDNGTVKKITLSAISVLSLSRDQLNFISSGGSKQVDLGATGSWTASTTNPNITVSPVSGSGNATLTITAPVNNSTSSDYAYISITAGASTVEIGVNVAGVASGENWVPLDADVSYDLKAVDFVDDNIGYIGGPGVLAPTLLKTTNGGSSWTNIAPAIIGNILDIKFTSSTTGFILTTSASTPLMKTTNGGSSWTHVTGFTGSVISSSKLYLKSSSEVYVYGDYQTYFSSDGGNSWSEVSDLSAKYFYSISFPSSNVGYAINNSNDEAYLYKTTDAGVSWTNQGIISSLRIRSMNFSSDLVGYAVGESFIIGTTDGGVTWSLLNSNVRGSNESVSFVGGKAFIGGGFASADNWSTFQYLSGGHSLQDVSYTGTSYGYGVGYNGTVKKLAVSMVSGTPDVTQVPENIFFNNIQSTSFTLYWTNGDGDGRIVLIKANNNVDAGPTDATTYSANANFGSGSEIGSGNFVVFNGTGNSLTITGLTPGTDYYIAIFEYNGSGTLTNYTYSVTEEVTTSDTDSNPTAVLNASEVEKILLIPNPNAGNVEVNYSSTHGITEIRIVNTLGTVVKSIPVSSSEDSMHIDTSDLENGIYYVYLKNTANGHVVKKMIKN